MNKTIKIVLNRGIAIAAGIVLLVVLYYQLRGQLHNHTVAELLQVPRPLFLIPVLLLLPVNIGMEAQKWKMLVGTAQPISFLKALQSVLGGIALSMITPNRIGEYPGRLLFLKRRSTPRLLSVSVLGAISQILALLLYGLAGLVVFQIIRPLGWVWPVLLVNTLLALAVWLFFWRFERWAPRIENFKWLRRFGRFGRLLQRFSKREQWVVLAFALGRFAVFTLQYYLVLQAVGASMPLLTGFFLCGLFFWVVAVVPSIALAELGIRGYVSAFLFSSYTGGNDLILIAATLSIWLLNLMLPALLGGLLLLRFRLVK